MDNSKLGDGKHLNIAIGKDELLWHEKFSNALDQIITERKITTINYAILDIDKSDWIKKIAEFDILIWKPFCLGPESVAIFKEKIYFINKFLKKQTMPNLETTWHYDSKVAQSYLFEFFAFPAPKTWVTNNLDEALELIENQEYPLVTKKSWGASSANVKLLKSRKTAKNEIEKIFHQIYWNRNKSSNITEKLKKLSKRWFWEKLRQRVFEKENIDLRFPYFYIQEFIKNNDQDLRITVIGNKYAFGFWRRNRDSDFRASGSGRIDYTIPVPREIIKSLLEINGQFNFDSMAYDLLFENGHYKITEISYAYVDTALFNAPGYYEIIGNDLVFRNTHTWPQKLWVEYLLAKLGLI